MSDTIYQRTGVLRPTVSAPALQNLATLWETVHRAAVTAEEELRAAIDGVLDNNDGEATDAFETSVTGNSSSLYQLAGLVDAALTTRVAHASAGALIVLTQTVMDAVANQAARQLVEISALRPELRAYLQQAVLALAQRRLTVMLTQSTEGIDAIYGQVWPPLPLKLSQEQRRGSLPDGGEKLWKKLSEEEQRDLLVAIADDVMQDWDEADRAKIIFYSYEVPQPPGTSRPTNDGHDDALGFAALSSGEVWLNAEDLGDKPRLLSTVVHELQHIQQEQFRQRYDELVSETPEYFQEIREGDKPDPFVTDGSTWQEVERFKIDYMDPDVVEEEPFYEYQATEVDARRAGTEYLDRLTKERLKELLG